MSKSKKKFYAVAMGRKPGIYEKWFGEDGAEPQVREFPDARYQGFYTLREAQAWLKEFNLPTQTVQAAEPAPKSTETAKPKKESPRAKINAKKELKKGKVIIYTDGGCITNPGTGGYGTVLLYGSKRKELSAGFRRTTNNRMEIMACIEGLKALKFPCSVILFSDSQYVVNSIQKGWAKRWRRKGWMRTPDQPAENADLWEQLLDLCETHNVEFSWVRGHAGNRENERCDRLAREAALNKKNLSRDTAYETGQTKVAEPPTLF
jgi:ribonuclease HI